MKLSRYRKFVTALIGTGLTWAGTAYIPDGHVSRVEWYALGIAVATALGVYGVTNEPASPVVTSDVRVENMGVTTDAADTATRGDPQS